MLFASLLILRALGMEPSLSLDALGTIVDVPTAELAPKVTRLIDHSVTVR